MVSAIITAASLCDSSIREYRRSPSRNCSPLPHTEMYFRRCGCFSRCSCDRLLLSVFQCQNACHDFRCARHCHRICLAFSEQHTAGIAIHQACRRCKQLIRLALLLCRSHGHTSQKQKQDSQEKPVLFLLFLFKIRSPLCFFSLKTEKPDALLGPAFCLLLLHYMRFPAKSW